MPAPGVHSAATASAPSRDTGHGGRTRRQVRPSDTLQMGAGGCRRSL